MVKRYDYRGESLTLKELAHRSGLPATLIYQRINHYNYSVEAALSRGVAKRGNISRVRAAAPLLLEALKEAIEVIEKIKPDEYGNGTIVRGRRAIAVAEGE